MVNGLKIMYLKKKKKEKKRNRLALFNEILEFYSRESWTMIIRRFVGFTKSR